ncbi:MAG: hypothetical protein JWP01_3531 [Myxococcales bacterium]|nr:hypothetical protein [Myxococcales bacterium]
MQQAARAKFMGFSLKVPSNWSEPAGEAGKQFGDAFTASEKSTAPGMPPLFQPQSMNKYHTDTQKMLVGKFGSFIDGMCSAICSAWGQWQSLASMAGVIVAGPVATLGQVVGPPLMPLIMASAPKASPNELKYSTAIANVISTAWLAYTATIKIPGLPFWPMFTMCPSPVAPPTPNTPVPVIALTQVTAPLMPNVMKMQMQGMLGDPMAPYHDKLFEAICDAFDKSFKLWQASTMVTNVLGIGAVPSMALPIPVPGPVAAGTAMMPPGGFK